MNGSLVSPSSSQLDDDVVIGVGAGVVGLTEGDELGTDVDGDNVGEIMGVSVGASVVNCSVSVAVATLSPKTAMVPGVMKSRINTSAAGSTGSEAALIPIVYVLLPEVVGKSSSTDSPIQVISPFNVCLSCALKI